MKQYEEKLKKFIEDNNVDAKQILFDKEVDHKDNVLEAIKESGINFDDIIKTIVFYDQNKQLEYGNAVVAIVPATSRVNRQRVKELSNSKIKISGPEEVLILSGYPPGGVPPIGFDARFYIDKSLIERKGVIYAGGGSTHTLLQTTINEILKSSKPIIDNIIE